MIFNSNYQQLNSNYHQMFLERDCPKIIINVKYI